MAREECPNPSIEPLVSKVAPPAETGRMRVSAFHKAWAFLSRLEDQSKGRGRYFLSQGHPESQESGHIQRVPAGVSIESLVYRDGIQITANYCRSTFNFAKHQLCLVL